MTDKSSPFGSSLLLHDLHTENQRLRAANTQMLRTESEQRARTIQCLQELLSDSKNSSADDIGRLVQLLLGSTEGSVRETAAHESADCIDMEDAAVHRRDWDMAALRELAATGAVGEPEALKMMADAGGFAVNEDTRFMVFSEAMGVYQASELDKPCLDVIGEQSGFFWLDVVDATKPEMDRLARVFGIHPLTVEDILEDTGDKIEEVSDYHFVVYRAVDAEMAACPIAMVVKRRLVLTFHGRAATEHVEQAVDRLAAMAGIGGQSVVYVLLDGMTDALTMAMRTVALEVDQVDELVMVLSPREKADVLQRTGLVRRRLLALWRLMHGKPEVVRALMRMTPDLDERHLLGDVLDHLGAMQSACAHCDMVLARAHSNYMGQISLELGDACVGTTVFSSQWLVITAILLPIQFVTGLFGMNVPVPFKPNEDTGEHENLRAWMTIMGSCIAFVVVFGGWAKWKKIF